MCLRTDEIEILRRITYTKVVYAALAIITTIMSKHQKSNDLFWNPDLSFIKHAILRHYIHIYVNSRRCLNIWCLDIYLICFIL